MFWLITLPFRLLFAIVAAILVVPFALLARRWPCSSRRSSSCSGCR